MLDAYIMLLEFPQKKAKRFSNIIRKEDGFLK